MLDEPFRKWMSRTAAAPARVLWRLGATPNQVTVGALIVGLGASVVIGFGAFRVGLALWLASRMLDGYDGILARLSGQESLLGGFLDITCDMLAYSAMAVGFAVAMPQDMSCGCWSSWATSWRLRRRSRSPRCWSAPIVSWAAIGRCSSRRRSQREARRRLRIAWWHSGRVRVVRCLSCGFCCSLLRSHNARALPRDCFASVASVNFARRIHTSSPLP